MKAKKAIGLLASIGVLLGSFGTMSLIASADTSAATVKTVLQDFSTLTDISYTDGSYSDPLIRGGNQTGLERIENADGTYSLGVKTSTGTGTAAPASTQIALSNRAPADTKAIAIRLTMPQGSETAWTDAKTVFFNSLYVDTPAGNYNVYLQHAWNGCFINASAYGFGYESDPIDYYLIDAATGTATKKTLNGPAMYEGYNFMDLSGFDGWVVIPMEYWMDHSGYDGMPYNGGTYPGTLGNWATGEGDILYTSLDPTKINTITVDMSGALEGYNPVYHEIAAISDIDAFVASFKTTPEPEPEIVNGKLVLQDFSKLTDLQNASGEMPADPIFLSQYNGFYNNVWTFNSLSRVQNTDGSNSLKVTWNGVENWRTASTVYVKFDNAVPAETKAIAVKLSLTAGSDEAAQNAYSAHFPALFVSTPSGAFSPYLKYAWRGDCIGAPGYEDKNVTVYRIDTNTGEKATITLKDLAEQGTNTIFEKGSFEGWVVLPLDYWMEQTNYNSALGDWATGEGDLLYTSMDPTKLLAMSLGMGNSEDGYESTYHEIAAITDMDAFMASFNGDVEVTAQPEDIVVSSGDTASFSVTATSESTITYQWQKSVNKGEWTDIEGANAATYTTPAAAAADNGTRFRCKLTTETAAIPTVTDAATLYVDKYPDVTIDYTVGSDPISADVFQDAKGKNVNIIINVKDGDETVYTWTINGKDITDAVAFNPEIEVNDVADIDLDETAPDALYFETKQTGKLPGKATVTLDTSFNFFENEELYLYSVDAAGKLTFAASGMKSGVSTSTVTLSAAGSFLLNNAEIAGATVPTTPDNGNSGNSGDSDVADTGVNELVGLLTVALFGIALAAILVSKESVKTK